MEHNPAHLHISLSKYFSMSIANLEPFVEQLGVLVQDTKLTRSRIIIETGSCSKSGSNNNKSSRPTILINDERTRSFWCWNVSSSTGVSSNSSSNDVLVRLVGLVDTVLKRYKQPTYYQPPTFHISIASFAGDLTKDVVEPSLADKLSDDDIGSGCGSLSKTSPARTHLGESKKSLSKEEDDDVNDSDDDDDDDSIIVVVDRIICSFGTTKEFVIPLL
jgi:hypothetical protein